MALNPHHPLIDWWIDHATREATATATKAAEYGTADLIEIGRTLNQMAGNTNPDPRYHMETGIMFYALGKIHRIISSHQRDEPAKDDTWFDLAVYAKMVLAARAGAWPTGETKLPPPANRPRPSTKPTASRSAGCVTSPTNGPKTCTHRS